MQTSGSHDTRGFPHGLGEEGGPAAPLVGQHSAGYHRGMTKFLVVVTMLLVQVQPLVGAALCLRHQGMASRSCDTSSGESADTMQHGDGWTDPADHECFRILACSLVPPVVLPTILYLPVRPSITSGVTIPRTSSPPAVVPAGPFHPPKA